MKEKKEMFVLKHGEKIYLDKIFFNGYEPILHTCINDNGQLFLCAFCRHDKEQKKWLISEISEDTIISMLKDEISLREAFLKDKKCRVSISFKNQEYLLDYDNINDWGDESEFLPDFGEYVEAERGEFEKVIKYFENLKNNRIYNNFTQELSKHLTSEISKMAKTIALEISQKITKDISDEISKLLNQTYKNISAKKSDISKLSFANIDTTITASVCSNDEYVECKLTPNISHTSCYTKYDSAKFAA